MLPQKKKAQIHDRWSFCHCVLNTYAISRVKIHNLTVRNRRKTNQVSFCNVRQINPYQLAFTDIGTTEEHQLRRAGGGERSRREGACAAAGAPRLSAIAVGDRVRAKWAREGERLGGEAARPGDKKISMQYPAVDSWYRVRDIGDDECGKIGTAL
jgi:hypothetical protein